jgi:hypothetical protein
MSSQIIQIENTLKASQFFSCKTSKVTEKEKVKEEIDQNGKI